jgi:hypothetical protein
MSEAIADTGVDAIVDLASEEHEEQSLHLKKRLSYRDKKLKALYPDPDERRAVEEELARYARTNDTPEGFMAFYFYITGGPMPAHAKLWTHQMYNDKLSDRGSLIFAFRGSWKTTTISQLFTCFRMGHEPWKANLVLQNNDATAQNTTLAISQVIATNPRWKIVFPSVIPDKKKGWGALGYWIIDKEIDIEEWAELTSITKDPSLLGLGISSGSVIGKHPTGVLLMDDIHDEKNSSSDLERAYIVKVVAETVFPMAVRDATRPEGDQLETWSLTVGTPWHEQDAYHYIKDTGEFGYLFSPLLFPANEGDEGAVEFDHKELKGWFRLAWGDRIPYKGVISLYNLSGHRGFWRMYLLSLIGASDLGLPFMSFPHQKIPEFEEKYNLVSAAGVDYASVLAEIAKMRVDPKNRSKFALVYGYILPTRVFVITGGILGHYTQLKAEGHVRNAQSMHDNHRTTGVEMNGKGEEFFSLLARDGTVDMLPVWTGKMSKDTRTEMEVGPWLEMGKIMISDEDTPFLNDLRKALWEFPYGNRDVLDAMWVLTKTIPDVLVVDRHPNEEHDKDPVKRFQRKNKNPFSSFGARRHGNENN